MFVRDGVADGLYRGHTTTGLGGDLNTGGGIAPQYRNYETLNWKRASMAIDRPSEPARANSAL